MTYEEAKDKFFPLLSGDKQIFMTVSDLINIIVKVTNDDFSKNPSFLAMDIREANRMYHLFTRMACHSIYADYSTMGDILQAGREAIVRKTGVGRKTIDALFNLFLSNGYNFN